MSHTRILLSAAILLAVSTALHAQETKQPIPSEPYLIHQFLPRDTPLKKGYFITEGQLESLSPEARAEFEKLLRQKADQLSRMRKNDRKAPEEYQEAYKQLKELLAERDGLGDDERRYRYMIGVTVEPNEGNGDGGVIVSRVLEDSPAETAGIAAGDVILSVKGPRRISSPQDLIAAVEDSGGKEIVLHVKTYSKEGTDRSLKIVPVERPDKYKTEESQYDQRLDAETRDKYAQATKQFKQYNLQLRTIHPGIYWDQTALQQDLPENVTITVSKSGKAPAKIIVTRDAESWNMNETEVDQLPENLRAPVKRLITQPAVKSMIPLRSIVETQWKRRNVPATQATTSKQLQQIQQQLEALQKAVDKLQQQDQKPE